jgi:hypothetical protein
MEWDGGTHLTTELDVVGRVIRVVVSSGESSRHPKVRHWSSK